MIRTLRMRLHYFTNGENSVGSDQLNRQKCSVVAVNGINFSDLWQRPTTKKTPLKEYNQSPAIEQLVALIECILSISNLSRLSSNRSEITLSDIMMSPREHSASILSHLPYCPQKLATSHWRSNHWYLFLYCPLPYRLFCSQLSKQNRPLSGQAYDCLRSNKWHQARRSAQSAFVFLRPDWLVIQYTHTTAIKFHDIFRRLFFFFSWGKMSMMLIANVY